MNAIESQYLLSETAAEHGLDVLVPVWPSDLKHSSLPIREQHQIDPQHSGYIQDSLKTTQQVDTLGHLPQSSPLVLLIVRDLLRVQNLVTFSMPRKAQAWDQLWSRRTKEKYGLWNCLRKTSCKSIRRVYELPLWSSFSPALQSSDSTTRCWNCFESVR